MQHNILFFFACLNFELIRLKDLLTKVAAMRRKCVVFSKKNCIKVYGKRIGTVITLNVA